MSIGQFCEWVISIKDTEYAHHYYGSTNLTVPKVKNPWGRYYVLRRADKYEETFLRFCFRKRNIRAFRGRIFSNGRDVVNCYL